MRRFVTAALLALFVLQSSGAAMATPAAGPVSPSLLAEVHIAFSQTLKSLANTHIGAFVLGRESQYEAMHAPAPDFSKARAAAARPPIRPDLHLPKTMPVFHSGAELHPQMADLRTFNMHAPPRNPFAAQRTDTKAAIARNKTVRPAYICPYCHPAKISAPGQAGGTAGTGANATVTCWPANSTLTASGAYCSGATAVSSNPSVATATITDVSSGNAAFTYVAAGTATITFSWSGATSSTNVTVTAAATPTPTATPTPQASSTVPTTGINPWWTYEEGSVPGVGKWMVNAGTGNLLVQEDDVDVHERGIDLAFRATYNSMSRHDYANSDGSTMSNFGNGWTNTFDAHLANPSTGTLSVYDIDGSRYDYSCNSQGVCSPPPGMQGTSLWSDGGCGYYWQKKSGTIYYFWSPTYGACAGAQYAGYNGRLYMIYGRNHNNWVRFDYSWSGGDASRGANVAQINAVHADGQRLTLQFADFNGYRELASITRPDGVQVTYQYDGSGDLTGVFEPVNNSNYGYHQFQYWSGQAHQLMNIVSPLYAQTGGGSGGVTTFWEDGSARATNIALDATVNFTPGDGTGQALQPSLAQGYQLVGTTAFAYPNSGETQRTDTDGHATNWFYDSTGRVTQTQEWTGAPNNIWLTTNASWDGNNNLTETVDARNNPTDYGYDGNGNTIWVQGPQVSTSMGGGRPVARYSYDQYNNLLAYCNPEYVWTTGATSCNAVSGVTHYTWNYSDTNAEPYGYLTDTYTPLGYHHAIAYNTSAEGGDFGLPTSVTGDGVSQQDGSTRTPTQTFTYDALGNLVSFNKGNGAWSLTYDSLNRDLTVMDPDNVTSYTCYYADGSKHYTETAAQHALDGNPAGCQAAAPAYADSYTYDADGNELTTTTHYGQGAINPQTGAADVATAGVTQKWYDGADRLVEVRQPQDTRDYYGFAWMTRYIYDLSQGNTVSINGGASAFRAYGNLYKTQECLAGNQVTIAESVSDTGALPAAGGPTGCTFQDVRGNTFDALDRSLAKYEVGVGAGPESTATYDGNGYYGLLSQKATGTGQIDTLAYDNAGHVLTETFNDGTPNRRYTYDPDGRTATLASASLGSESRSYDADGRLTSATTPSGLLGGATVTYGYYADGLRKTLSLSVPATGFSQSNLFAYNYRPDGARSSLQVADGASTGQFVWTYTNAGRELSQSDPDTGKSVKGTTYNSPAVTYVAKTYTYDAYGRVASLQLPVPTDAYSGFIYDAEGHVYGEVPRGSTIANRYDETIRGELPAPMNTNGYVANGAVCAQLPTQEPTTNSTGSCSFDARSNALRSTYYVQSASGQTAQFWQTYHYDAAGRQIADDYATCYNAGAGCATQTVTSVRSYDADSHVTSQTIPPGFQAGDPTLWQMQNPTYTNTSTVTQQYTWAPDGHLATFQGLLVDSSNSNYQSAASYVWDGDDILLEQQTYYGNPYAYLNIEKLGFITPTGQINVYDRDWTGNKASDHSSSGFDAWNDDPQAWKPSDKQCEKQGIPCTGGTYLYHPATTALSAARSDGYTDAFNVFQGVRAYDPNSAQWTSPDAYSGDVHDPMSQKPYMWNNNNPLVYQDPSGYIAAVLPAIGITIACPECAVAIGVGAVVGGTAAIIYHLSTHHDDQGKTPAPEAGPESHAVEPQSVPVNQINNDIKTGKAPRGITRVDRDNSGAGGQVHAHFDDGTAIKQDGSPSHRSKGTPKITRAQRKYLKNNGFKIH